MHVCLQSIIINRDASNQEISWFQDILFNYLVQKKGECSFKKFLGISGNFDQIHFHFCCTYRLSIILNLEEKGMPALTYLNY